MIWIVDDIETKPGMGPAFLDAYLARYAPGSEARGLRLIRQMVEPAMWLDDAPNRLLLIWEADDAGVVWGAKHQARQDESVTRWWTDEAPAYLLSRRRSTMASADQIKTLTNV